MLLADGFHRWFRAHWDEIDRRAAADRAAQLGWDHRPLVVLTLVAVILALQRYCGECPTFTALFPDLSESRWYTLVTFAWWTGTKVVGYLLIPVLVVKRLGGSLRDYGFALPDAKKTLRTYLILFGAILPVVVAVSFTRPFQATYPFYRLAARSWGDYLSWELMYGATFVALEFFFRGFMLFALERAMGSAAIFVAVVPYCMIHFGKPLPEVLGAIGAGIVLGTVSLSTRSIWSGTLVHVSVGWTMDALSMVQVFGWPGSGYVR